MWPTPTEDHMDENLNTSEELQNTVKKLASQSPVHHLKVPAIDMLALEQDNGVMVDIHRLNMNMLFSNRTGYFEQDNAPIHICVQEWTKEHHKEVLTWCLDLLKKQIQSMEAPILNLGLKGSLTVIMSDTKGHL